jgi:bifunctional ADP-heptose synthase (sugar kinase/adenylyltransferase)
MLAALRPVDFVVVFDETTPEAALDALRPDIHCKGADYAPPDGKPIPEQALVESYGGRVEFRPLVEERSTTGLAESLERDG